MTKEAASVKTPKKVSVYRSKTAKKVNEFLNTNPIQYLSLLNTIVALYLFDISAAWLPKSTDGIIASILLVSFILFTTEICANLYARRSYFCSFFMILDILGTLSLIPDLVELYGNIEGDVTNLEVARAGRAGRLARTAGTLKFTRFARIFRVIRLFRLARVFRVMQHHKTKSLENDSVISTPNPSKLGILLSDTIAKRIIIMVIILIVSVPYMSYDRPEVKLTQMEESLDLLEIFPPGSVSQDSGVDIVFNNHPDLLFLQVHNEVVKDILSDVQENLRTTEMLFSDSSSNNSTATFTMKKEVTQEALAHMYLLTFVILIFAFGSFVISKDAQGLVVKPIERMTIIIRKLAGTICLLSADDMNNKPEDDLDQLETETILLETVITKIAKLFDVRHDDTAVDKDKSKSKAERMLTGSKSTQIVAKGATYDINITERIPESNDAASPSRKFSLKKGRKLRRRSTVANLTSEHMELIAEHPELRNMESMLKHPQLSGVFKVYMAEKLQLENYMFWQECEKFKIQFEALANRIITNYISDSAMSQVNINATMRSKIETQVIENQDVNIETFDGAQAEIYKLIKQNNYDSFLKSDYCLNYLDMKEQNLIENSLDHIPLEIDDDMNKTTENV